MFHEFFHILQGTSGHVGTARNVARLYVVDAVEFPEWCSDPGRVAKVEVVGVLGFASVLLLYSCSAPHSYTREQIPFPAPKAGFGRVVGACPWYQVW